jgi:2'-5' RNA ligase
MALLNSQSPENKKLFFLALLFPARIEKYVNQIKQHFATYYQSKAALKSPPHLTLQPPFFWDMNDLITLENFLKQFVKNYAPVPIKLDGFAAFKPRVIYINVLKNPELLTLQKELNLLLESSLQIIDKKGKNRPFSPHVTVGFKDLSKTNFYRAWDEFKNEQVSFKFTVNQLTLLSHNGQKWEIQSEFTFSK